jgi:pimeloyl-ACP methyl ester carboxylesterase
MRPALVLALGAILLSTGCAPAGDSSRTAGRSAFDACADRDSAPALAGSRCARLKVPLRHTRADTDRGIGSSAGTGGGGNAAPHAAAPDSIEIFVRLFPADGERRGTVWMLAGGPQSGAMFYGLVDRLREAFPGFDLVVPDHRGTGRSTRICPEEEDVSSPGGSDLVGREFASCYEQMRSRPEYVRAFSLTNNARDVALLVERLGASGRRLLFGTSYGTRVALRILGATDAEFDGLILDSLVPLPTDSTWGVTRRAEVADAVGHALLARCDNDARCRRRLGGDALGRYKELLRRVEEGEVALPGSVPGGDLEVFLGRLLDFPASRRWIPSVIETLATGDSSTAMAAVDSARAAFRDAVDPVRGYPAAGLSIPFANTVLNSEVNLRPELSAEQLDRETRGLEFSHPLPRQLLAGRRAELPLYDPDPRRGSAPDRIPPTLVLQGTLDAKTHYQGARRHAEALHGAGRIELVSVRDAPHYLLMNAPGCFVRHVRPFAVEGTLSSGWCEDPRSRLDFSPGDPGAGGI